MTGRTPSWADCPPDDDIERVPMVPYVEPDEGRGTSDVDHDERCCMTVAGATEPHDICPGIPVAGRTPSWADCPPDDDIERVPMVPYVEPDEGRVSSCTPTEDQPYCGACDVCLDRAEAGRSLSSTEEAAMSGDSQQGETINCVACGEELPVGDSEIDLHRDLCRGFPQAR